MTAMLRLEHVAVRYGRAISALTDVSLDVGAGEIVALLGANGAGKSTTLRAVSNLLPAQRGEVAHGRVLFDGQDITRLSPHRIVRLGIAQVLEGRHCFRALTIEDNLRTGAAAAGLGRAETASGMERVFALFPGLADKRRLAAGLASGGEQQMAAIGRALMSRPRLLMLDEPSMGLAPKTVESIFAALAALRAQDGISILLAEQNAATSLVTADRAVVLEHGAVALEGRAADLRARDDIRAIYLGLAEISETVAPSRLRVPATATGTS